MTKQSTITVALAAAVPLGLLLLLLGVVVLGDAQPAAAACGEAGGGRTVDPATLPTALSTSGVAGYSGTQLANAALIMNAGAALGLSVQGQTIGVMTAMGESGLRVLDVGDVSGPDSRGLFQQRGNGAWGSYAGRMDPTISSTNFFTALLAVDGWQTLSPTETAHRVQRNADPGYYAQFWNPAGQVVAALTGVPVQTLNPGGGNLTCSAGGTLPGVPLPAGAWTKPAIGPVTSPFGWRQNPTGSGGQGHTGVDIGAACNSPIFAAAGGVVTRAGHSTGYGNLIAIDHGTTGPDAADVVTRYAHMYDDGVLVTVGQTVVAGQQIARIGSNGDSTGCHLHFEVLAAGVFIDPAPFLLERGIAL